MPTTTVNSPLTLEVLGRIDAPNLEPSQQATSLDFLKKADVYQQSGVKFDGVGIFHSYPEYIYALWLESQKPIKKYIPQPYLLYYDHKRYIPDFYVIRNNQVEIIELKSRGAMEWPDPILIETFFSRHDMRFYVLDNKEALTHETEALHWLPIVQSLCVANRYNLDTRAFESELLRACARQTVCEVGDLITPLQHCDRSDYLIALYRLIHRHDLIVDLTNNRLDYDTPIRLCI